MPEVEPTDDDKTPRAGKGKGKAPASSASSRASSPESDNASDTSEEESDDESDTDDDSPVELQEDEELGISFAHESYYSPESRKEMQEKLAHNEDVKESKSSPSKFTSR